MSLRSRNPKAVPDAWEQAALLDSDRRVAAQEPASTLEEAQLTQEGGQTVQRYIRALPKAGRAWSAMAERSRSARLWRRD